MQMPSVLGNWHRISVLQLIFYPLISLFDHSGLVVWLKHHTESLTVHHPSASDAWTFFFPTLSMVTTRELRERTSQLSQSAHFVSICEKPPLCVCENASVFAVWRRLVDATAHSAASRLAAAEEYQQLIGRASRSLRTTKDVRAKKVSEWGAGKSGLETSWGLTGGFLFQALEQLQEVQGEVVEALRGLQQIKKSYHQVAHVAHVAREKAADAQTRSVLVLSNSWPSLKSSNILIIDIQWSSSSWSPVDPLP